MKRIEGENIHKIIYIVAFGSICVLGAFLAGYTVLFGPAQENATAVINFEVTPEKTVHEVAEELKEQGLIKSSWAFTVALSRISSREDIRPGGYELRKSMDVWTITKTLNETPRFVFVTFPKGIRKEQMAEILAENLSWSDEKKQEFLDVSTTVDSNVIEGVYYPDTYFIPSDQSPTQVASRLRSRFTDVFEPYAKEAQRKGIPWKDVLILASLIEREAAKNDTHIVSGILWNRLENKMLLQVDASLQYIRGTSGNWWPVPRSEDKYLASPFNTYKYPGLPPHPINNPSLESIEAALNPQKTPCLFYLHDTSHQIHCSVSYAEHKANIERYLR